MLSIVQSSQEDPEVRPLAMYARPKSLLLQRHAVIFHIQGTRVCEESSSGGNCARGTQNGGGIAWLSNLSHESK
jgi:hypothetical protein